MGENKKKNSQYNGIEVYEDRAMIYIPKDAVQIEIVAKLYDEEKDGIVTVSKTIDTQEIKKALKDAEDNYIDPEEKYVLTEKGLEYLEMLERSMKGTEYLGALFPYEQK